MKNVDSELRILIVENEFVIFQELQELFQKEGFQTNNYVDSFEEAIKEAGLLQPNLAILDIRLDFEKDSRDGIELASQLKKEFSIPILFLSAYSDAATLARIAALQENHFILKPKPLDHAQLLASVELVLSTQSHLEPSTRNKEFPTGLKLEIGRGNEHYVALDEILMIQTDEDDAEVVCIWLESPLELPIPIEERTSGGKTTKLIDKGKRRISLKKLKERSLPDYFIQTSRDCIVNGEKIKGLSGNVLLIGGYKAEISRAFRKEVREFLDRKFG